MLQAFGQALLTSPGHPVGVARGVPLGNSFRAPGSEAFGTTGGKPFGTSSGERAFLCRHHLGGEARRGFSFRGRAGVGGCLGHGAFALRIGFGLRFPYRNAQLAGKLLPQPVGHRINGLAQVVVRGHA